VTIPQLKGVEFFPASGVIQFNKHAAEALRSAFREIEEKGLLKLVLSWNGSYNPRVERGGSELARHALGTAFDINFANNVIGAVPAPAGAMGSVRELVPIFEKHGFEWGGKYDRPVGMHFEFSLPKETPKKPGGGA